MVLDGYMLFAYFLTAVLYHYFMNFIERFFDSFSIKRRLKNKGIEPTGNPYIDRFMTIDLNSGNLSKDEKNLMDFYYASI